MNDREKLIMRAGVDPVAKWALQRIEGLERDAKEAAACLLVPQPGIADTIWFGVACTLYEHLLSSAEIDGLTGRDEADYQLLTGRPYPKGDRPNWGAASFVAMDGSAMPMVRSCSEEKRGMTAVCKECKHRWTAIYLPMEITLSAKVLGSLHCPMCGANSKRIGVD